jgi:competence protein ComEC
VPRAPLLLPAIVFIAVLALLHQRFTAVATAAHTARYWGTVTGDVRVTGAEVAFPFAVDGGPVVRAHGVAHVRAGERLLVRGRIEPLDEPRNPGEPSPRELGLDEGIAGELTISALLARAAPDLRDARVWMPLARERASAVVHRIMPEPQASVVAGALWGERGTLPQALHDEFAATGTVHVLVTAGLHLGIVAALIGALCALAGVPRVAAAAGTIPIVYLYAWFSGWHLPSQRAAAMIAIVLVARACGARPSSLNTLALAAIVVAATWPVSVTSASFALSFSCVGAIVFFAGPVARALRARVPERVAEAVGLTIATQIGVWPLTAALFFVVAPFAMPANAIVVPLMGLVIPGGALAILTAPIPAIGPVAARAETLLVTVLLAVVHGISTLPLARLTIPPPPGWAIAAYDAAMIVAWVVARRSRRAAFAIGAIACAATLLAATLRPPHGLEITVLDVGQGDAIVIRTPRDRTIMIDAGGMLERGPTVDGRSPAEAAGERIVLPYLYRAGIGRIDLLVLTHPHGDHVGAAAAIINAMPVGMIFDSGQTYSGRAYRDAMAAAGSHHVPVVLARRGMQWTSGDGVTLDVLAPSLPFLDDTGDDVNENSIVVMLHYRAFRELFMGDAGEASEARLLVLCHPEQRRGAAEDMTGGDPSTSLGMTKCENDLHADVVKVGHHGSRYGSTTPFVAAVHPRVAVISVGRHNTFGHPAPATIEEWSVIGAHVLRTDQCGAIFLVGGVSTTMLRCTTP